jgi:GntR family transcriptional regulator, transcriptional repressor for pyruvate dehydrogenase complex
LLRVARRVNLSDNVRDQLTQLILSGGVSPGGRLPSERELCRQMNIGRTSLREAIRALQALGLIEVRHGKGMYVRPDVNHVVPYSAWPSTYKLSVHDVLELRLAIEPRAASLAATRGDSADFESIAESLAAMEEGQRQHDLAAMVMADLAFHQSIVKASKNPLFVEAMNRMTHVRIESLRVSLGRPERPQRVLGFHRDILEAIQRRDPQGAFEAMQAHVLNWADEMGLKVRDLIR